jgi:flagellar basal-body rod protein FlgC
MPHNDLFAGFDAAASAMSAERARMTVATENLANAGSTKRLADGLPYARQRVSFGSVLDQAGNPTGMVSAEVVKSPAYLKRFDPSHPDADKEGQVTESDINPILELVDLLTATKSYEANANATRGLIRMHEAALRLSENI